MERLRTWVLAVGSDCVVCLVCVVCLGGIVHAGQPDTPTQPDKPNRPLTLGDPLDCDLLPNGLLVVQYDSTGDGVPDFVTLHQVTWSGWTAQPIAEIEAQAQADRQGAFIVEYDQDRYIYLTREEPLSLEDDLRRTSREPWLRLSERSRQRRAMDCRQMHE